MASLKDIASELNVSKTLVSAVLNNKQGTIRVSPQLAETIKKKAAELGYQKNSTAAALSTGRHDTLGAFIHQSGELGSGLLERLILGITKQARAANQKLTLSLFETSAEFYTLSNLAHRGAMDGLIVGGTFYEALGGKVCAIAQSGLPVITLQNEPMHPDVPNVAINERAAGYLATRHLIEQGCRRIAYLLAPHRLSLYLRYEGYCRALAEAGLEPDETLIHQTGKLYYSLAAGEEFARKVLQENIRIDGVVAESDNQALGAINVFQKSSVRIPEDVKIIGIDNAPFCTLVPIPISSVSLELLSVGATAVELLLKLCAGEKIENAVIEPILHIRRSSGGE